MTPEERREHTFAIVRDHLTSEYNRGRAGALLFDVDRLARAMSGLDSVNWPKRWEPEDFEWVARQIAAEYARLGEPTDD